MKKDESNKVRIITINMKGGIFKKLNFNKRKYAKKAIDIGLILALVMVCLYSFNMVTQKEFSGDAIFVNGKAKKKLPIYSVDTNEKKVAISFDAAWGADDTDTLLQILKDNDVKTTFFLCGYWVDDYTDEVKKIVSEGHEIGNHGNNHAHGAKLSLEKNKEEIDAVTKKVELATGTKPILFRPPFGEYNNTVLEAAEELGYYTIQWDVDTSDIKMQVQKTL